MAFEKIDSRDNAIYIKVAYRGKNKNGVLILSKAVKDELMPGADIHFDPDSYKIGLCQGDGSFTINKNGNIAATALTKKHRIPEGQYPGVWDEDTEMYIFDVNPLNADLTETEVDDDGTQSIESD